MTVKDPGRIPVGLFQGERLSDDAVRRLSVGASRIVAFADEPAAATIGAQWSRVAAETEVEIVPAAEDIRDAIIECAKRKVIWLATPTPKDAKRFVASALQGAAAATEFEIPSVAVHVVRDGDVPGSVAWLTQTGEMSGYGVLYAAAVAEMGGRSVTLITPSTVRAPRTPEALDAAERFMEESGVEVVRLSDPSPIQRVLGGEFGAIVHPVLDAPGGRSLLHPGELPAKSVADGNAAAVVELIEKSSCDVIAVFDGVQLVYGSGTATKVAASVALGVVAFTGVGAAVAPGAMAAPAPASAPAATGNTAVVRSAFEDVLSHLAFPHSGRGTTLQIRNTSSHSVTISVTGFHGHGGSAGAHETVTIAPGETVSVNAPTGGIKQWSDAVLTHIDGNAVPHIGVMHGGTPVPLTPQSIPGILNQAHVPNEEVKPPEPPKAPTATPVVTPNQEPTQVPTATPGAIPQQVPQVVKTPNQEPTQVPTATPGAIPQQVPQVVKTPNQEPTQVPTATPGAIPQQVPQVVKTPNQEPTQVPTATPGAIPQQVPQVVKTPNQEPTQVPTATPGAIPQQVPQVVKTPNQEPTQVPTATPGAIPQQVPQVVKTPNQEPTQVPTATPGAIPQQVPQVVKTPNQEPTQVPQAIPQAIPQEVPGIVAQTPGAGTVSPGTTGETAVVHGGGQVTPARTGTGTTTPATAVTATTPGTTQTTTHTSTDSTETATGGSTTQLAHTGAGETGLLAGLAAAMIAAGAGIMAAAKRTADEREEGSGGATS